MAFPLAIGIGAGLGALGGLMGRDSNESVNSSSTGSSQSQGSWTPHAAAAPGYGYMAGNLQNLMQSPVPYFPGQGYVGPSAATQYGFNQGMNTVQNQLPGLNQATMGVLGRHSQAGDVANNPYVNAMHGLTQNALNQNLTENLLPGVNAGAMGVNAMGSGRHGLMQGQAVGDTQQAIGDARTNLNMGAYNTGMDLERSAYSFAPQMQQMMMAPSNYASQIGQQVEGYQGNALQDAMARFSHQYQQPWNNMQNVGQTLQFMQPMGTTFGSGVNASTGTAANPNYQSPLQAGLGGAMSGASMGAMMSDRRLKKDLRRIGATARGTPIYEFEYIWGGGKQVGVMADEAPAEAVRRHPSGYLMVDYASPL